MDTPYDRELDIGIKAIIIVSMLLIVLLLWL